MRPAFATEGMLGGTHTTLDGNHHFATEEPSVFANRNSTFPTPLDTSTSSTTASTPKTWSSSGSHEAAGAGACFRSLSTAVEMPPSRIMISYLGGSPDRTPITSPRWPR